MSTTEIDLYLPISKQELCQVIDYAANNLEKAITSLGVPQIASLLLLQYLPKMKVKQSFHVERTLERNIAILNSQLKSDGLSSVITKVVSVLNLKDVEEGYNLLLYLRITLLDEEAIREQDYLTFEGQWDYTFNERHRKKATESSVRICDSTTGKIQMLTPEQSRIYQEVKAQTDDHMHVQGYAGTGKSYLIRHFITMLDRTGVRFLILAERQKQIEALVSGINQMEHVFAKTFASLIYEIIPQDLTAHSNQNMLKSKQPREALKDQDIIEYFNITASDKFRLHNIVKAIRSTLYGFCHSGDGSIQISHISKEYASRFDEVTKQVVVHYATELWKETLNPTSKNFKPPIRGYHRIKWAALNGWKISDRYTHILIDECHNLAKPMLQILDNSPQAIISLGDEYQNLQGRSQQRANTIRYREVTNSARSGCSIEPIVNSIISIHPSCKTKARFYGNQLNSLIINYYDKPEVPDKPAAILVSDMWGLFEWAQRIASKDLNFSLLADIHDLNMFVNDCIELYLHGTWPRHGELFRFSSWDEVAKHYYDNQGFQRIDRMLHNGYQYKDWQKTLEKVTNSNSLTYLLGRIDDALNHEFETVMVAPDVANQAWQAKQENMAVAGSKVYIAVTRAKHCLILPVGLRNWIEDISAS